MRDFNKEIEKDLSNLGESLGRAIIGRLPNFIVIATVQSVNEDDKVLDAVVDDTHVFSDIALDVFPNGGNSIYLVPTVGSLIILGFIEGYAEAPFIIKTTQVDKIIISIPGEHPDSIIYSDKDVVEIIRGSSSWKIEDNLITLNGGKNRGIMNISQIDSLVEALSQDLMALGGGGQISKWMASEWPKLEDKKVIH